ncbi:hypothetical protein D918_07728 [Trichuris suis]|nr:hypothetical protein D918_07728 [Trichuris suis]
MLQEAKLEQHFIHADPLNVNSDQGSGRCCRVVLKPSLSQLPPLVLSIDGSTPFRVVVSNYSSKGDLSLAKRNWSKDLVVRLRDYSLLRSHETLDDLGIADGEQLIITNPGFVLQSNLELLV